MTAPPTPDEMRVAHKIVADWLDRGEPFATLYIADTHLLVDAIAAALSTTAAQAAARGMKKAAEIANGFYPQGPELGRTIAYGIAAAILASGLQTTPPAAPAEEE